MSKSEKQWRQLVKYAIVKKLNVGNAPHLGYVQPYIVEEEREYKKSDDNDFPNSNKIFILSGYDEIDESFSDDELFRIPYHRADNFEESNPGSCLYAARGRDVVRIDRWEYFQIMLDGEMDYNDLVIYNSPFIPTSPQVFILAQDNRFLLGPFRYDEPNQIYDSGLYEIKLYPNPYLPGIGGEKKDWYALQIPYNAHSTISVNEKKYFISNLDNLIKNDHEIIDFIGKEQLLKWGNDLLIESETLQSNAQTKRELNTFQIAVGQLSAGNTEFFEARRKNLAETLDQTENWIEQRSSIISEFLGTKNGKEQVKSYLNSINESLEEGWRSENKELEDDLKVVIDKLKSQILEKESELENIQQEMEQTNAQINRQKQNQLSQENQVLEQEISVKKEELKTLLSNTKKAIEIGELESEQAFLKRFNEEEREKQQKLKDDLKNLQATTAQFANQTASDIQKKLIEFKPFIDLLNGIVPTTSKENQIRNKSISRRDDTPSSAKEFIEEIVLQLKGYDRDYKFEEVANFLVSIQQNFLTMFAGLPGTGKTSLVTYLANATGLTQHNRFHSVAVARGWTSQRDIVGFYNPLNGTFQSSPTNLYSRIKLCNEEYQEEGEHYPFWILLDEANLSPIEHYWSAFLDMCDPHTTRNLPINDPSVDGMLLVPKFVKFMGTINYDNTTESLSPRVIDRVPIIKLHAPKKAIVFDSLDIDNIAKNQIIPFSEYEKLFAIQENEADFTLDEQRMLENIITVLSSSDRGKLGIPIIISPRKQRLIRDYCGMARQLLQKYSLQAFDFATAQYILPTINGSGPNYRERLSKLRETINSLSYSYSILDSIIEVGDNEHQFYRFFV